jgi:hypothetical protein
MMNNAGVVAHLSLLDRLSKQICLCATCHKCEVLAVISQERGMTEAQCPSMDTIGHRAVPLRSARTAPA